MSNEIKLTTRTERTAGNRLSHSMRTNVTGLIAAAIVCLALPAHATMLTQALDFSAGQQSMWGPGGSAGFDYSGGTSVGLPFSLGSFSIGYSVGASSGQVWGNVNGNLSTSYTNVLAAPGTTSIGLSYFGDSGGGGLHSTIGAHAQLTSSVGNVGPDFQLNVDRNYTPVLDARVTASNSLDNVVQLPLVDIYAAAAGVAIGVSQTDRFTPTGIGGTLFYSLQGSGVTNSLNYLVGTNAGVSLPVDLSDSGRWDFWFGDPMLNNSFNTSLAMDLGAYASTVVGCGPILLSECTWNATVLSPTIYTGPTFALDFNTVQTLNHFSIRVPEPPTLVLLGIGLCLIGGRRLRNRSLGSGAVT